MIESPLFVPPIPLFVEHWKRVVPGLPVFGGVVLWYEAWSIVVSSMPLRVSTLTRLQMMNPNPSPLNPAVQLAGKLAGVACLPDTCSRNNCPA